MTDWTDAELGALLTETFAAREELADPATATRIAAAADHRRPSRLPVLIAAATVLVAVGTAVVVSTGNDGDRTPLAPTSTPSTPAGPTLAENRATALRVSEQTLASVQLMDGAIRTPAGGWATAESVLVGDDSLSRDAWYAFGASPQAVERFLLRNPPPGMQVFDFDAVLSSMPHPTVKDAPGGVRYLSYVLRASAPNAAYQGPNVLVQWKGLSGTTAVRFSTSISARQPRAEESRFTGERAAIEVEVEKTVIDTPGATPRVKTADLGLSQTLTLLNVLDSLVGSVEPPATSSCEAQATRTWYTITVRPSSGPVLTYSVEEPGCTMAVRVTRDGEAVPGTLDPWILYVSLDRAFQRT